MVKMNDMTLRRYQSELALPGITVSGLDTGFYSFERIGESAYKDPTGTADRIMNLDCYGKDKAKSAVETESKKDTFYMLTDLKGDGLILKAGTGKRKKDIGYALFYPVANEVALDAEGKLPEYFAGACKRADWAGKASYLSGLVKGNDKITPSDLYHFYDYAIKPEGSRRNGLGRLVTKYSSDMLFDGSDGLQASLGFIDSSVDSLHADSMIASMKSGRLLGKRCKVSPDGNHESVMSVYSPSVLVSFTGGPLSYRRGESPLKLRDEVIKHVSRNPGIVVGFNPETGRFGEATVEYRPVSL
jgi:hypothetical protein